MGIERFRPTLKMYGSASGEYVRHSDHLTALSEAEARGRRQGLEEAAKVAEAEPEFLGDPPQAVLNVMLEAGPVENARAACRTTKRCIVVAIRALISEDGK